MTNPEFNKLNKPGILQFVHSADGASQNFREVSPERLNFRKLPDVLETLRAKKAGPREVAAVHRGLIEYRVKDPCPVKPTVMAKPATLEAQLLEASKQGNHFTLSRVLKQMAEEEKRKPGAGLAYRVSMCDRKGDTALHLASWFGHRACVQSLIHARADLEATNLAGELALHQASRWGHKAICEMLVKRGCSPDATTRTQLTAKDVAQDEHVLGRLQQGEQDDRILGKDSPRRPGVVAEVHVTQEKLENWERPTYEKPDEARQLLADVLQKYKERLLIGHWQREQFLDVADAMFEKQVAAGESVTVQGEEGDAFYIVTNGQFDVFVARGSEAAPGQKATELGPGTCFGEVALMCSLPRQATVTAACDSTVFCLDRTCFIMMLASTEYVKESENKEFIGKVPLFDRLNAFEQLQLSDLLEETLFNEGEVLFRQGDAGDQFFVLKDGSAEATLEGEQGTVVAKVYETPGDYFGEIALLSDRPRQATVTATGTGCVVLSVGRADFELVLGPIRERLHEGMRAYQEYQEFLQQ